MAKFEVGKKYKSPNGVAEILKRTETAVYFRQGAFFFGWRNIKKFDDTECFEVGNKNSILVCANNAVD